MPSKSLRPCKYSGCKELVTTGYCDNHKAEKHQRYDRYRGSSASRGYDARWRRYREVFLKGHPLCECEDCKREGMIIPATVVDHIIPHKGNYKMFWDTKNHQAMSKACHDKKTASEDGGFGNAKNKSKKLVASELHGVLNTNYGK